MRNSVLVVMAMLAILMSSCYKNEKVSPKAPDVVTQVNNLLPGTALETDGKEDTDGPIIMQIVKDENQVYLPNVPVAIIIGADTLVASTNPNGICFFRLPDTGECHLTIDDNIHQVYTDTRSVYGGQTDTIVWDDTLLW